MTVHDPVPASLALVGDYDVQVWVGLRLDGAVELSVEQEFDDRSEDRDTIAVLSREAVESLRDYLTLCLEGGAP